jgi:hypothetical protein
MSQSNRNGKRVRTSAYFVKTYISSHRVDWLRESILLSSKCNQIIWVMGFKKLTCSKFTFLNPSLNSEGEDEFGIFTVLFLNIEFRMERSCQGVLNPHSKRRRTKVFNLGV